MGTGIEGELWWGKQANAGKGGKLMKVGVAGARVSFVLNMSTASIFAAFSSTSVVSTAFACSASSAFSTSLDSLASLAAGCGNGYKGGIWVGEAG